MLLASFGSPSAMGYAISNILRRVASEIFGAHFYIQATHLEEFKQHWSSVDETERQCVVFFSDCPHREMTAMISKVRAPVVVVVEDFDAIFSYVRRSRGMDFAPAARFTTQVVCAMNQLLLSPNVMRVSPADCDRSLAAVVQSLVSFFGAPCGDARFAGILSSLVPPQSGIRTLRDYVGANFPHFEQEESGNPLSAAESKSLEMLSEAYGRLISGAALATLSWPVPMFLKWDVEGAFLDGPIDLVGPARFIICGPYLHLPEGAWRMSVQIDVEDCFSDNRIGADIFSERILTAITAKLPASGRHAFDLDFTVVNPLAPVEIRMQLLTGAIEGRLSLVNAVLSRLEV